MREGDPTSLSLLMGGRELEDIKEDLCNLVKEHLPNKDENEIEMDIDFVISGLRNMRRNGAIKSFILKDGILIIKTENILAREILMEEFTGREFDIGEYTVEIDMRTKVIDVRAFKDDLIDNSLGTYIHPHIHKPGSYKNSWCLGSMHPAIEDAIEGADIAAIVSVVMEFLRRIDVYDAYLQPETFHAKVKK